eukprot:TRINITY_DN7565_c0_g1_i2.p1 TRINITY_DN7565_c0_g1~~TRINITY_DN7565_c0_g1_i2.p1  ORF type:complete len:766 (+),score=145.77 TRINITY_DN7565_c0_g1_i2:75-2372(+)
MPSFFGWLRGSKKEKANGRGASPSTSNASSTATTARTVAINKEIEAAMQEVTEMSGRISEIRSGLRDEMNQLLNEKYDVFTKEQPLHVAVATFNVGEKIPRSAGDQYIDWVTASSRTQSDLLAIGLQEVDMSANTMVLGETSPKVEIWEQFVTSQLERLSTPNTNTEAGNSETELPPASYVKIRSKSMGGLFIIVFAKESIAAHCSNIQSACVKTGQVKQVVGLRNKGAVAIRLTCFGKRILFINTHLEAHTEGIQRRNKGFDKIVSELRFEPVNHCVDDPVDLVWPQDSFLQDTPRPPIIASVTENVTEDTSMQTVQSKISTGMSDQDLEAGSLNSLNGGSPLQAPVPMLSAATNKENNLLYEYDYLFWAGDLNYRLWNIENSVCRQMIKDKQLSSLRTKDQLSQVTLNQQAFCGFTELPLNFPPTYKYDAGEATYDSSAKQRVPSWTDRILYRCNTENTSQMFPPVPLNLTPESGPISFVPITRNPMPYSFYSCCESSFQERVGRNLPAVSSVLNATGSYFTNGPSPKMLKGRSNKSMQATTSMTEEATGIPLCTTPGNGLEYPNLNEVPIASSIPEELQGHRSKEGTIVMSVNRQILADVDFSNEGGAIIVSDVRDKSHGITVGMTLVALDNIFIRTIDEVNLIVCSDKDYEAVFREPLNETASMLMMDARSAGGGYHLPKFRSPLFRNEIMAVAESYSDHPVLLSDHRPVSAFFKIKCLDIKPKSALSLLSASSAITSLSDDLNKLQEKVNLLMEKRGAFS